MSDYNFYGVTTPVALNTGPCNLFTTGLIQSTDPMGNAGDVVYMKISDTEGVVVMVGETATRGTFDPNIYTNIPSSFTPLAAYYFDSNADLLHSDVSTYRLETNVSISTYSESYRTYNTSFEYSLIVDDKRRFFNNDVKTLISTPWVVFADNCNSVAYLVSFGEDTFVTLNNKFKSSLTFNIATR